MCLRIGVVLLLALAGCGGPSTGVVTGTVSLNGQPLERGLISFASTSGEGGTAGSSIEKGQFRVADLLPGKYEVHIAGESTAPPIMPNSPEARRTYTPQEIQAMMDPLPPDTTGKDQTLEVQPGEQTHDFKLESKSRAAP